MDTLPPEIIEIIDRYALVIPEPPPKPSRCASFFQINLFGIDMDLFYDRLPDNCNRLANPNSFIKCLYTRNDSKTTYLTYGYCTTCKQIVLDNLIESTKPKFQRPLIIENIQDENGVIYSRYNLTDIFKRTIYVLEKYDYLPIAAILAGIATLINPRSVGVILVSGSIGFLAASITRA